MNIDGLHEKAGTKRLYPIHGRLPTDAELNTDNLPKLMNIPVLYGDFAPMYDKARRLVFSLEEDNSCFIIIGTSYYTAIAQMLVTMAKERGAEVIEINKDADLYVPEICKELERKFGKRDNQI